MRDHKISQRRACDLVGVDPKTVRRERPPDHADIRKKMHEIAGTRRRFGYRRVGILLEREGFTMNEKKLDRFTGRKARRCGGGAAENAHAEQGFRCQYRTAQMCGGHWILYLTPSVRRASSAFWR